MCNLILTGLLILGAGEIRPDAPDPRTTAQAPAQAAGYPSRDANLDALPGLPESAAGLRRGAVLVVDRRPARRASG